MATRRAWLITLLALLLTLAVFELTRLDLAVQSWFYDPDLGQWIWSRDEVLGRLILYDGIKTLLIAGALLLSVLVVFGRGWAWSSPLLPGFRLVLFSLLLIPAVVGLLKSTTNVACPRDLISFGGDLPYVGVFQSYPEISRPEDPQRCFPAGHASSGFALMSTAFLFQRRRYRKAALAISLVLGWSMGIYKMALGDHFLSHTLVSMELAWLIILTLAWFQSRASSNP